MHSYTIKVKGIRISSPLGWYTAENAAGNVFEVSVAMRIRNEKQGKIEQLSQTVDYALIYPLVKNCFGLARVQLLEHIVEQIGEKILEDIEMVDKVRVEVKKMNPVMGPDIKSVAVKGTFLRKFEV